MSQQGWECPKCGRVYAPWQPKCSTCVGASVTWPGTASPWPIPVSPTVDPGPARETTTGDPPPSRYGENTCDAAPHTKETESPHDD